MLHAHMREVVNGYIVVVRRHIDGDALLEIAQEIGGLIANPAGILAGVPRLLERFSPTREYVFGTAEDAGSFIGSLQDDVDADRDGWAVPFRAVPEPAEPSPVDDDYVIKAQEAEQFALDLIIDWPEGGLSNGDEVLVPRGVSVSTENGFYRFEDGDTAIFCGLHRQLPEMAILEIEVDGEKRVLRLDRSLLLPPTEEITNGDE